MGNRLVLVCGLDEKNEQKKLKKGRASRDIRLSGDSKCKGNNQQPWRYTKESQQMQRKE